MADCEVGLAESNQGFAVDNSYRQNNGNCSSPSLPISSPRHISTSSATEFEKKSLDGSFHQHDDASSIEDSEIKQLYLTFDTELPMPCLGSLPLASRNGLPPPINLQKYQSPVYWSRARKNITLALSCTATVFTAFSAGGYSPGAHQMMAEWHVSLVAILVGITTFTCGFAIAPMILAPFSEINGRKPVFLATGVLFVLSQVFCGITKSYAGMLVSRFFVGVGGSTFSTMVGGVVSDIYASRDRNAPMALFSGAAMLGTGLGPLVCGLIAQHLSWRWMFYLQAIVDGTLILLLAVFFRETRGNILLSRKATALNVWYEKLEIAGCPGLVFADAASSAVVGSTSLPERIRWKVKSDEERASLATMIRISLSRPFHLLLTEPILFFFSLWVTFSWMVLYLTLAGIPLVYSSVYNFDIQSQGAVFGALCIAGIVFTPITIFQERLAYKHNWFDFQSRTKTPEHRLVFACVQSLLLPIGLFVFGWSARSSISPAVSALGLMLATCGIFSIYLATFNYLADVYGAYASSALAAQSFCRNMAGGALPLFTGGMFHRLGIGPASSLLGACGLLLGIVPWVLLICGARIRGRSPFAVGGKGRE